MRKRVGIISVALVLALLFAVCPLAQGAQAAISADGILLNNLFNHLLDRHRGEGDNWGFFDAGNGLLVMTWPDAVRTVVYSAEFQSKIMTDTEYVTRLYRAILWREPDPSGLVNWVSMVPVYGRLGVLEFFVTCDEFRSHRGYQGP